MFKARSLLYPGTMDRAYTYDEAAVIPRLLLLQAALCLARATSKLLVPPVSLRFSVHFFHQHVKRFLRVGVVPVAFYTDQPLQRDVKSPSASPNFSSREAAPLLLPISPGL